MEAEIEKVVKSLEGSSVCKLRTADREEQVAHNKGKQDNDQQESYAKEHVAKVDS